MFILRIDRTQPESASRAGSLGHPAGAVAIGTVAIGSEARA